MTISSTTLRKNGASLRGYLAVFRGALVLIATITADAPVVSAKTLAITISVGSIGNVQRGYRVVFESSGGGFKGETHVRWGGTLDSTHLPVREFSESEFLIKSGDTVKVFALMAWADKLVEDTELFDPDGVPVGTYQSLPPPLACSGGLDAGFVDGYETGSIQTYRTVTTDGSNSLILDPSSNLTHISHLWTLVTGVAFAPGSANTDVSPTLRVNVGEYTIYHDVTDTDNGQTWRQCVTYSVYDGVTRSPVSVVMESAPNGTPDQGWSCTFRAVDFLDLTAAPDGSPVAFFVRERIDNTWQSLYASSGRAAIKLVGFLSHDESDLTPEISTQRFEVISPLTRLGMLPGFSKILIQNATPNDWSQMRNITTSRAMIDLIRFYTFALDGVFDLLLSFFLPNLPYPELWLQKESPLQQVNEIADGIDSRFSCTRTGMFRLDLVPQLTTPIDRTVLTTAYTFTRRDVARLVARRDQLDTVETLELHATIATSSGDVNQAVAVFSRSPASPGHGTDFITIERIIAGDSQGQIDAQQRGARRYAWKNGVYTDSTTGLKMRAPEIDVEMRLVYDFLDFDDQIVMFDSFPNPRDIDLTAFLWTLTKVQLNYDNGRVISTFQALTDSPLGGVYVPPPSPAPTVTTPPPPLPINTVPDPGIYGRNMANIALFNSDNNIYYLTQATNPSQSGGAVPVSVFDLAAAGMSGTLMDFTVDAFSPNYIAGTGAVNGWIVTSAEVRPISDIFGTPTLGTAQALSPAPTLTGGGVVEMDAERSVPNWVIVTWYNSTSGTYAAYSTDGVTFTTVHVTSFHDTGGSVAPTGLYIDPHTAGTAYLTAHTATGSLPTTGLYKTTTYGASWTLVVSPAVTPGVLLAKCLVVPFPNSASPMFFGRSVGGTGSALLMRVAGVGAAVDISPDISGTKYGPTWRNRSFSVSPTNPNVGVLNGWNAYNGSEDGAVFRTTNLGATPPVWTLVEHDAFTFGKWLRGYVAGDDPNTCYELGVGGAFGVMIGNLLDNRSAALVAAYPTIAENIGLCGKN